MSKIRTRYAPSPTGYFHIGGARTALFNYLYAKHNNGTFIVRIEDTDIERNVKGGIESQLDNLTWLGIHYDESIQNPGNYGPYIQSEKIERYKTLAYKLVEEKKAYFCFCTKEELQTNREISMCEGQTPKYNRACLNLTQQEIQNKINEKIPYVIRLKMHDNATIEWEDMVRGKISIPTSALTDPVILKSNGVAMYNFAVVVDDYDMDITNVIRGEEHISNTPYQIAIKNALGFDFKKIQYGHLSVIVNENGKKLSKRDLTLKQFISDYKQMGFDPRAVSNFLGLLGWAPTTNKEKLSMEEMIQQFDINHVSKSPAFFDYKKMLWLGNEYMKIMNDQDYVDFVSNFLTLKLKKMESRKNEIFLSFKNQLSYASQINDLIFNTFFDFDITNIDDSIMQMIRSNEWQKTLNTFKNILINSGKNTFSFDEAKDIINTVQLNAKVNGKDLFMPLRIALTSKEHGIELNKIISFIEKKEIIDRINLLLIQLI